MHRDDVAKARLESCLSAYHACRKTPNEAASPEALRALGVLSWRIDPDTPEGEARLAAIKRVRGYNYEDLVTISPTALPGYEQKIRTFYEEHIHSDEEIRYVVEGSGYFDVRDLEDRWIRIAVSKGDMLVLPEGIYHRFTLDTENYIKVPRRGSVRAGAADLCRGGKREGDCF